MVDRPLQLLGRDQDLAEDGVDASLAAVQTCCSDDGVLVIQDVPTRGQLR